LLLFITALWLAYELIVYTRPLLALTGLALLSLPSLLLWTLVVTAPVSLVTGGVWSELARASEEQGSPPVSCFDLWLGAGAVLGGCVIAGLFHLKIGILGALLIFAALLCLAVPGISGSSRVQKACLTLVSVLLLAAMTVGQKQGFWLDWDGRIQWGQWETQGHYQSAFQTARAEYLLGRHEDRWWVVREGRRCESIGDLDQAGQWAALGLCQNPGTQRVLIVGEGYALSERFLSLPGISTVDWFHSDPHYVAALRERLPASLQLHDERFSALSDPLAVELLRRPEYYDIVFFNIEPLRDPAHAHYLTAEFLEGVKAALSYGGMVIMKLPDARTTSSDAQTYWSAQLTQTFDRLYNQVLLAPGESTFLLAANLNFLKNWSVALQGRFLTVEQGTKLFPDGNWESLYHPSQAMTLLSDYRELDCPRVGPASSQSLSLSLMPSLVMTANASGVSLLSPLLRGIEKASGFNSPAPTGSSHGTPGVS